MRFPELYVKTFEAFERGDYALARELQEKICELSSRIYTLGRYGPAVIKGIKSCLSLHGITSGALVPPFNALTCQQREMVGEAIGELGLDEFWAVN